MKRKIGILAFALLSGSAAAHTLFIKPDTFFYEPGVPAEVGVINGTFEESEARLTREMMHSVTIVDPDGKHSEPDDDAWRYDGKVSFMGASFEAPGNYLLGIKTFRRKIRMNPEDFNFYLRYEGLWQDEAKRQSLGETGLGATESYQKFGKAILQVGEPRTDSYAAILGYDVEIVPLTNPYELAVGDIFRARVLKYGEPLAGEHVYATHEGHYLQDAEGIFDEAVKTKSDASGLVEFEITAPGRWYVRFIDLERSDDPEYWYSGLLVMLGAEEERVVYESKWATLTFEIR